MVGLKLVSKLTMYLVSCKDVYEWDSNVLSHEFKNLRTFQQMLNFTPTPCVMMNELFHEPIKHDYLQDMIHMFIMHILPRAPEELTNILTK
jgi:hypothetical protein